MHYSALRRCLQVDAGGELMFRGGVTMDPALGAIIQDHFKQRVLSDFNGNAIECAVIPGRTLVLKQGQLIATASRGHP